MNILIIDTRDNKKIVVRLLKQKKIYEEKSEASKERAQATLPLVQKVMEKAGVNADEINEINVATGPGSFTGLRVGIAVANALSFSLQIKINGKKLSELENPQY